MPGSRRLWTGVAGAALLAAALPVVAQDGPESLLPPGFGDPVPATPQPGTPQTPTSGAPATSASPSGGTTLALPDDSSLPPLGNEAGEEEAEEEDPAKYDLPPTARRSLARIGLLGPENGGIAAESFGPVRGRFLAGLMRGTRLPPVSRWASIVTRRVLLSEMSTPSDINGADLAAERAALLLRMGEADAARLLVQDVDSPDFTPRLYEVAMDSYLAAADPAGFCHLLPAAADTVDSARWFMARAICASFQVEQGTASSLLNQAAYQGKMRGIDYRLAEKVVASGPNSRRSVRIEWEGVTTLDPWRFGLATATNVDIPDTLYATSPLPLRAWEARAPMVPLVRRIPAVAAASRMGVMSGAALVDFYSQLGDPDLQDRGPEGLFSAFRRAYGADTIGGRIDGMRDFWSLPPADGYPAGPGGVNYAALPALARAAAALPPAQNAGDSLPWLIAAMLSSGYDRNAARWIGAVESLDGEARERAWALLAVGLPGDEAGRVGDRVQSFINTDRSEEAVASQMLVAALAGLGRISTDNAQELAGQLDMTLAANSRWSQALARAASLRAKGTVMLLAAAGLQVRQWSDLPPGHLYVILSAMRAAGLEAEARMIAAEAMTRL